MPTETTRTARTLVELLRHQAERYGDKVAFRFCPDGGDETDRLTYRELDLRARAVGAALQARGAAGHRVLHIMDPGLDNVVGFFGCLYAGAVAVPVNEVPLTFKAVIPDAQAGFVLANSATRAKTKPVIDEMIGGSAVQWCVIDEATAGANTRAECWRAPAADPDDIALIHYLPDAPRSPKGIVSTHRNILHNVEAMHRVWPIDDSAVAVSWLPQYHGAGLVGAVVQQVYIGGSTVLVSPAAFLQQPMRWLQAVSRYRASLTAAPYFGYRLCLDRSTGRERAAVDLSGLALAVSGPEPLRSSDARAVLDAFESAGLPPDAFVTSYGLPAATVGVAGRPTGTPPAFLLLDRAAFVDNRVVDAAADDPNPVDLVGAGPPLPGLRVVIVDPETRQVCAPDGIGEIWVSGDGVSLGYWQRPRETAQTFSAFISETGEGPFLRTGDLGFLRTGQLFVIGRWGDLITVADATHYPGDIEATVQGCHPALLSGRGAAVAVRPHPREDNRLVVVAAVDDPQVGADELDRIVDSVRTAVTNRHGLEPQHIILVEPGQIPSTASGRIHRGACRERFEAGELQPLAEWHARPALTDHIDGGVQFSTRLLAARLARHRRRASHR